MSQTNRRFGAGVLMGFVVLFCPAAWAGDVYKCVVGGKTSFSSKPVGEGQDCQPVELHVVEPSPTEVARELEQRRSQEAVEKKQKDAEAAQRAQAAKRAEILARGRSGVPRRPSAYPRPGAGSSSGPRY